MCRLVLHPRNVETPERLRGDKSWTGPLLYHRVPTR
jgi:hypothetical protein